MRQLPGDRCKTCDHVIGYQRNGKCVADEIRERPEFCWGHGWGWSSEHNPVDWRKRALAAEARLAELGDASGGRGG